MPSELIRWPRTSTFGAANVHLSGRTINPFSRSRENTSPMCMSSSMLLSENTSKSSMYMRQCGSWPKIESIMRCTGQVGLGVGSWPSNRGIESQVNAIIPRDLTQECRKNM